MHDPLNKLRVRTLLAGRIIFNNKCSTFNCTIRSLSAQGALLELGSTFAVPRDFFLEISARGTTRACTILRRTRDQIEVAFV